MHELLIAVIAGYFILVWLKTNAFAEYMFLFRLGTILRLDEYKKLSDDGYDGSYVDFIHEYYRHLFITRLIVCPICLSFWVGLFYMLGNSSLNSFIVAPLTLFFYLILNKLS